MKTKIIGAIASVSLIFLGVSILSGCLEFGEVRLLEGYNTGDTSDISF